MLLPPDKTAGVCLIGQHLVNPLFTPLAAIRGRYAVFIEPFGDLFQPLTLATLSEYSLGGRRLLRVDIQGIPRLVAILDLLSEIAKGRPAAIEETAGGILPQSSNHVLGEIG
jgi:hypothetical protein